MSGVLPRIECQSRGSLVPMSSIRFSFDQSVSDRFNLILFRILPNAMGFILHNRVSCGPASDLGWEGSSLESTGLLSGHIGSIARVATVSLLSFIRIQSPYRWEPCVSHVCTERWAPLEESSTTLLTSSACIGGLFPLFAILESLFPTTNANVSSPMDIELRKM